MITLRDQNVAELRSLLDRAREFYTAQVQNKKISVDPQLLQNQMIVQAFIESSTRTKTSFELAARRLGLNSVAFSPAQSALNKGESLKDTALTLKALGATCFVVRDTSSSTPFQIAEWTGCPVISAGHGAMEHPTQALLDALTLETVWGHGGIAGKTIVICGDIDHSRVARSQTFLFTALGAQVVWVGPKTLVPQDRRLFPKNLQVEYDFDHVLFDRTLGKKPDAVVMLRLQFERHEKTGAIPSVREYRHFWGMTADREKKLSPEVKILHPGPINRGVEIDGGVAESSRSLVELQVEHGIATRMAVMERAIQRAYPGGMRS